MKKKINIAIAGFGNIGSYFYKVLQKNKINIFMKTAKIPLVKYISAKNIRLELSSSWTVLSMKIAPLIWE